MNLETKSNLKRLISGAMAERVLPLPKDKGARETVLYLLDLFSEALGLIETDSQPSANVAPVVKNYTLTMHVRQGGMPRMRFTHAVSLNKAKATMVKDYFERWGSCPEIISWEVEQ